ncbi:hypothetical protein ACELLULO517_02240 [Acidisoma cellulosilytica]|uniref:Glycosyltransferase RgtA/B/C/D-like domain-containing protein n=1 Tax=Acidisoma cellulosilyticum TaxID=2802395 RepID=A0A963YXI7_9PROT|nr:hypothetical protein [Acidisoma cellulosilyticum]MCB8879037.1 hypothetical protein [Acidisoma cellulosilyticum]
MRLLRSPILIFLLAALLTRVPMFGNPVIYTDEEFYLLVGSRILHGAIPYVDLWDRKPVGLFLLYAAMRALGGHGLLAYQIVGTGFVVLTAELIRRISAEFSTSFGAVCAGLAYILWLNLGHAGAGQSPIFYNLPVCAAGLITLRAVLGRRSPFLGLLAAGCAVMLLMGLAMQIKYSALFEGMFFGLTFLFLAYRERGLVHALTSGTIWIAVALLPTLLAAAVYLAMGQFQAFIFANFISIFSRADTAGSVLLLRLMLILVVLLPLILCAILPLLDAKADARNAVRFVRLWLAAAILGLLIFGTYLHHYLLPVLVPAAAAAASLLGRPRFRMAAIAMLAIGFVVGESMMLVSLKHHGSAHQFDRIAQAIDPAGCLYVYSGDPAFYNATHACIATRFAFPSHLSRLEEAKALGVDPLAEVNRIMNSRPATVIVSLPYSDENEAARQIVLADTAKDYHLALRAKLGRDDVDVYRLAGQ